MMRRVVCPMIAIALAVGGARRIVDGRARTARLVDERDGLAQQVTGLKKQLQAISTAHANKLAETEAKHREHRQAAEEEMASLSAQLAALRGNFPALKAALRTSSVHLRDAEQVLDREHDAPATTEGLPSICQLSSRSTHVASVAADEQSAPLDKATEVIMNLGGLLDKICDTLNQANPDATPPVTPATLNDAASSLIERAARSARELANMKIEVEAMRSAHREVVRDAQAELAAIRLKMHLEQRQHDEALRVAKHKRAELIKQMKDEHAEHAAQVTRLDQHLHAKSDELADAKAKHHAELRAAEEHAESLSAQLAAKEDAEPVVACSQPALTDEASVSANTTAAPQYEGTMGESATVA